MLLHCRFLYDELAKVFNGETSEVLQLASRGQCRLKDGVALHLFTSNTPCTYKLNYPNILLISMVQITGTRSKSK